MLSAGARDVSRNILHRMRRTGKDVNLSLVVYSLDSMKLDERKIPNPEAREVLLFMKSVMICKSDISSLKDGGLAGSDFNEPILLGHEASGVVLQVGSDVKHLKKGDRVSVIYSCAPQLNDASLCQFYSIDADFCYKLPNMMSFEEGALLVPLAVGVYACRHVDIKKGSKLLIWGAEAIGLITLLIAKSMGVDQIAVADENEERLETAKRLGANGIFHINSDDKEKNTVKQIKSSQKSLKLIECSFLEEVDIYDIYHNTDCFSTAAELVTSGKINVREIITHRFDLEQYNAAFKTLKDSKGGAIKVMIWSRW